MPKLSNYELVAAVRALEREQVLEPSRDGQDALRKLRRVLELRRLSPIGTLEIGQVR